MKIGLFINAEFKKYDTEEILGRHFNYWEKSGHEIIRYQYGNIIRSLYIIVNYYVSKRKPDLLIMVADADYLLSSMFIRGKKVILFTDKFIESYNLKNRAVKLLTLVIFRYINKSAEIINFTHLPLPDFISEQKRKAVYNIVASSRTKLLSKLKHITKKQQIVYLQEDKNSGFSLKILDILLILLRKSEDWKLVLIGSFNRYEIVSIRKRLKVMALVKSVKIITKIRQSILDRIILESIAIVNLSDNDTNQMANNQSLGTYLVNYSESKIQSKNSNIVYTKGVDAYYFAEKILELWENKDVKLETKKSRFRENKKSNEYGQSLKIIESI